MTRMFSLLVVSAIVISAAEADDNGEKCKILSLKGGGIHGAWEAGVIKGIVE